MTQSQVNVFTYHFSKLFTLLASKPNTEKMGHVSEILCVYVCV